MVFIESELVSLNQILKRIRSCFKQQELQPMSVSEQIIELLALTSGLFDIIPIEKIKDAESVLLKSNEKFPAEILKQLFANKELSDSDHKAILDIAHKILAPFQDKPEEKDKKA